MINCRQIPGLNYLLKITISLLKDLCVAEGRRASVNKENDLSFI